MMGSKFGRWTVIGVSAPAPYGITEMCEKHGLNRNLIYSRLKRGWDIARAMEGTV